MLPIAKITLEKIKNNTLTQELPEFYRLKNIVETNGWHNQDITFDHSGRTAKIITELLQTASERVRTYLAERVIQHTKKELLLLTALFHDIGKLDTAERAGDAIHFPGHDAAGARRVTEIFKRTDLAPAEIDYNAKLTSNHLALHLLLNEQTNLSERFAKLHDERADIIVELVLLAWADMKASHLARNNPADFSFREKFYQQFLDNY